MNEKTKALMKSGIKQKNDLTNERWQKEMIKFDGKKS